MARKYTLLSRIGDYANRGRLGIIGLTTLAVIGATLSFGISRFNKWSKNGFFERAATAYFIGSDSSLEKINTASQNLQKYVQDALALQEELNEIQAEDFRSLEARIRKFESTGDMERAEKARKIAEDIDLFNEEVRRVYSQQSEKLENMLEGAESLKKYSTLWRRAVKVNAFITYEYINYAKERSEELKGKGGIGGRLQEAFESLGKGWIGGVLGKKAEDSEKTYEWLRQRILAYSVAETGKQGLANLLAELNQRIGDRSLGEGEKQTYALIRDSIEETGDTKAALEIVDYLQHGKVPEGLDNEAKAYLAGQKDLFDTIDRMYGLFMKRLDIVIRAEEVGIEIEKSYLSKLEELSNQAERIAKSLQRSDAELRNIGVNPKDNEYLAFIDTLKAYYLAGLAILCLAELGIGYHFARVSIEKEKRFKLQREYDRLAEEGGKNDA